MSRSDLLTGIFQKVCNSLQDLARKLFVRYRASHGDGTDERAIDQDGLRSCGALIPLVPAANQSCQQLNVLSNLPGDDSASSLVAACDLACQRADRTARAWMIAMCFAQIIIDERLVRDRRPARGSGIHLMLPHS